MGKYKAESVLPYDENERKGTQVRRMFDSIAPAYDRMNRLMTMGIDRLWRRKAVALLKKYAPDRVLDVATGTGDMAFLIYRRAGVPEITGIDISEGMLRVASEKAVRRGLEKQIRFECQDSMRLAFADHSFDAVTVAFGVRNFEQLDRGFAELYRVLRPGGLLLVLELSYPSRTPYKQMYRFYTRRLIPMAGKWLAGDKKAYQYLPESIKAVPQGEAMMEVFRTAGFRREQYRTFTFGTCSLYTGIKPG